MPKELPLVPFLGVVGALAYYSQLPVNEAVFLIPMGVGLRASSRAVQRPFFAGYNPGFVTAWWCIPRGRMDANKNLRLPWPKLFSLWPKTGIHDSFKSYTYRSYAPKFQHSS